MTDPERSTPPQRLTLGVRLRLAGALLALAAGTAALVIAILLLRTVLS